MPASKDTARGLQLWVNLAGKDKMINPAYQELKAKDIPNVTRDGVTAIVIAGEAFDVKSPVYTRTPVHYLHFKMQPNSFLEQKIPAGWNSFAYILKGDMYVGGNEAKHLCPAHHTLTLTPNGDGVHIYTKDQACEFVLLSGQPIKEPVVQHGPFVMNTQAEIYQTIRDFSEGKNGFEKAPGWYSEIGGRGKRGHHDSDDEEEL